MNYHAFDVPKETYKPRSFNAKLIPKRLEQLAKMGEYFDDKMI